MDVLNVFHELYRQFGPQGWWPTSGGWKWEVGSRNARRGSLDSLRSLGMTVDESPRYYPGKYGRRLSEREKFEIAIGAILTQNTAWKNVEKAIACLHREGLMSPQAIVKAPIGKLRTCIRASGYYKQKTRKVRIFCKWLIENYDGLLDRFFRTRAPSPSPSPAGERGVFEVLRRELLSLWGVGPETADSILLYAGGLPIFVVDAYTRRLCERHGVRFKKYEEYQKFFEDGIRKRILRLRPPKTDLVQDDGVRQLFSDPIAMYQEYHALIVAWGKEYGVSYRS